MRTQRETRRNSPPLKAGHDQVWLDDFQDLSRLSKTAFILRILYRLSRDISTDISNLSDLQIRKATGFGRNTIARARKELVENGDISPIGYTAHKISPFKRYKTCSELEQSHKSVVLQNGATDCSKMEHRLPQNGAPIAPKWSTHYRHIADTDKTDTPENVILTEKDFDPAEASSLRTLYPFQEKEFLKKHLIMRGYTEHAVAQLLEKVIYPNEYGYRRPA